MPTLPPPCTLEFRALQCARNDTLLFTGLNCMLKAGETLYVRGANGSGKSSLLRLLAGLAQSDAGAVLWCGTETEALGADYAAVLQYVGHHNGIKLDLTARENLAFYQALGGGHDAGAAVTALERTGLAQFAAMPARRLSAGQRRRLALARLLLWHAPLWFLDEPLTSLDDDGRTLFRGLMQHHSTRGGIIVMATHEVDIGANGPHRELVLR
jgi:heme exporter protein A